MNNIDEKLKRVEREDFIWFVYFFIIIGALLSNAYEKHYLKTNDSSNYKIFHTLNLTLFSLAFLIYLYFVIQNYDEYKQSTNKKEQLVSYVALIAALIFLIGGALQIYVELNRNTPDEDIGII